MSHYVLIFYQQENGVHMCKGVAVMDDRGREVIGAASLHGLDCLESKEQGEAQFASLSATPCC